MRNVAVLAVGLILCSVSLFAGEYLMNDSDQAVYSLELTRFRGHRKT